MLVESAGEAADESLEEIVHLRLYARCSSNWLPASSPSQSAFTLLFKAKCKADIQAGPHHTQQHHADCSIMTCPAAHSDQHYNRLQCSILVQRMRAQISALPDLSILIMDRLRLLAAKGPNACELSDLCLSR